MPYIRKGKTVTSRSGKRRNFKSIGNAKRWIRFNMAVEHGWKPTRKKWKA